MAKPAAETAEFAGRQGRFWAMHAALFANGDRLSSEVLLALASRFELNPLELRSALLHGTFSAMVDTHFAGGVRSGVNGTPCFFINGYRHDESWDAPTLSAAIVRASGGTLAEQFMSARISE